jgi:hypothetical protein
MIKFTLHCEHEHEFEAWFSCSATYDTQARTRQILCPVCGSDDVTKALMTPNVVSSRQKQKTHAVSSGQMPAEIMELMRTVRKHVEENAEYVGPRFADEARKIHYEEAEARGIYGEASTSEIRLLQEDGIDFHPLPMLPEDQN